MSNRIEVTPQKILHMKIGQDGNLYYEVEWKPSWLLHADATTICGINMIKEFFQNKPQTADTMKLLSPPLSAHRKANKNQPEASPTKQKELSIVEHSIQYSPKNLLLLSKHTLPGQTFTATSNTQHNPENQSPSKHTTPVNPVAATSNIQPFQSNKIPSLGQTIEKSRQLDIAVQTSPDTTESAHKLPFRKQHPLKVLQDSPRNQRTENILSPLNFKLANKHFTAQQVLLKKLSSTVTVTREIHKVTPNDTRDTFTTLSPEIFDSMKFNLNPPVVKSPSYNQPITEQLAPRRPIAWLPLSHQPITEQRFANQPTMEKPLSSQPMRGVPLANKPNTGKLQTNETIAKQLFSNVEQSGNNKPVTSQSTSKQLSSKQPIAVKLSTKQPIAVKLSNLPVAVRSQINKLITNKQLSSKRLNSEQPANNLSNTGQRLTGKPIAEQLPSSLPNTELSAKAPITEQQSSQQPIAEQLLTKQPITKQQSSQQSITEQLLTKQPITERLSTKQQITEQLLTKQPITEQQSTKHLAEEQLLTKQPIAEQLLTKQPITEQLSTKQPITEQQSTKHLAEEQFLTKQLIAEQLLTKQPITEQLSTKQPITTQPSPSGSLIHPRYRTKSKSMSPVVAKSANVGTHNDGNTPTNTTPQLPSIPSLDASTPREKDETKQNSSIEPGETLLDKSTLENRADEIRALEGYSDSEQQRALSYQEDYEDTAIPQSLPSSIRGRADIILSQNISRRSKSPLVVRGKINTSIDFRSSPVSEPSLPPIPGLDNLIGESPVKALKPPDPQEEGNKVNNDTKELSFKNSVTYPGESTVKAPKLPDSQEENNQENNDDDDSRNKNKKGSNFDSSGVTYRPKRALKRSRIYDDFVCSDESFLKLCGELRDDESTNSDVDKVGPSKRKRQLLNISEGTEASSLSQGEELEPRDESTTVSNKVGPITRKRQLFDQNEDPEASSLSQLIPRENLIDNEDNGNLEINDGACNDKAAIDDGSDIAEQTTIIPETPLDQSNKDTMGASCRKRSNSLSRLLDSSVGLVLTNSRRLKTNTEESATIHQGGVTALHQGGVTTVRKDIETNQSVGILKEANRQSQGHPKKKTSEVDKLFDLLSPKYSVLCSSRTKNKTKLYDERGFELYRVTNDISQPSDFVVQSATATAEFETSTKMTDPISSRAIKGLASAFSPNYQSSIQCQNSSTRAGSTYKWYGMRPPGVARRPFIRRSTGIVETRVISDSLVSFAELCSPSSGTSSTLLPCRKNLSTLFVLALDSRDEIEDKLKRRNLTLL